jgi:hypothetical protein
LASWKCMTNHTVDISWVDWAYKSSTCDSCVVDSAAIYIMVVKFINTICPPAPQLSFHTRAALSSNSNGTRSVYNRKNPKSSLYCEMSMMTNTPRLHGLKISLELRFFLH